MSNSLPRREHRTPAQREKILRAWRASSLPDQAFATGAGVGVSTLHAWRRRVAARPAGLRTPFVAVPNLLAAGPPAPAYRLQWPGGLSLELRAGFATGELAALLQLLPAL
jgi:hypothetical protein